MTDLKDINAKTAAILTKRAVIQGQIIACREKERNQELCLKGELQEIFERIFGCNIMNCYSWCRLKDLTLKEGLEGYIQELHG